MEFGFDVDGKQTELNRRRMPLKLIQSSGHCGLQCELRFVALTRFTGFYRVFLVFKKGRFVSNIDSFYWVVPSFEIWLLDSEWFLPGFT